MDLTAVIDSARRWQAQRREIVAAESDGRAARILGTDMTSKPADAYPDNDDWAAEIVDDLADLFPAPTETPMTDTALKFDAARATVTEANGAVAIAALAVLVEAVAEHAPTATHVEVDVTDQDFSGSLILQRLLADADGTELDQEVADKVDGRVMEALGWMDARNRSVWAPLLTDPDSAGERSRAAMIFDVAKVRAAVAGQAAGGVTDPREAIEVVAEPVGLTARQAHRLNQLADACAGTYQAALAVKARAEHIARQVSKGHHIEGFTSDVLGRPGREVQHYASQREVLIRAVDGCPQAAIEKALTNTTQHGVWFCEGDQYPTDPDPDAQEG